jgi:signal transduction histidine kinase
MRSRICRVHRQIRLVEQITAMVDDSNLHIVLVDDNVDDIDLIRRQLQREFPGVTIEQASAPEEFRRALEDGRFNLVITDFQLQWSDGLAVLRAVKARFPYRPVIMFTATGTEEVAVEALKSGLDDYIIKAPRHYVRLLASVRSVLQRTEAERRAADLQVRLEHLLGHINVGVFRAERNGFLVECNAAFLRLLNADSLDAARKTFSRDFAGVFRAKAAPESSDDYLSAPREIHVGGPRGDHWFLIDEVMTTTAAGQHFVDGLMEEITERKNLEREREQLLAREKAARQEAEGVSRMKDDFLAMVSHELRTPLTSIVGWVGLLRSLQRDPRKAEAAFESLERNARALKRLVNDLIDVSAIVTDTVRLDIRDVDPVSSLEGAIESLRPAAEAKGVQLVKEIDADLGPISADPDRLEQIVWNLVGNSIKFTPPNGRIQVRARLNNGCLQIVVSDTGIGIDSDFLPFVFDRFRQADARTTRTHGGLGLGLAIVDHIVKLHGGKVMAHSEGRNKGSTFTVELPLSAFRAEKKETPQSTSPPTLKGLRILLVEDDQDTREVIAADLDRRGASVIEATSAVEALQLLSAEKPDLMIMDIGIPDIDGYELLAKIRSDYPAYDVPAIALTAFASPADREKCLRAGFRAHIAKPVAPEELVAVIGAFAKSA